MANSLEIGEAFAAQMRVGASRLRDASGAPGALEVLLSDGTTVELGTNPHSGFLLRLRAGLDHFTEAERESLLANLVRISTAARFGTGWIGGCEGAGIATIAVALEPTAEGAAIASLIDTARSLLRPAPAKTTESIINDDLSIGENWLRI